MDYRTTLALWLAIWCVSCVTFRKRRPMVTWGVGTWVIGNYAASLTEKGRLFIEAWKKGDQRAAIELIPSGETTIEKKETDHAD